MANRISQVKSTRLEILLDKLVAVQMDLRPVCGVGRDKAPTVESFAIIAGACEIMHSAIADLRNIIHQVDSLAGMPEPASAVVTPAAAAA